MGLGIAPTRFTVPEFPAGNDRAGRNFTLVSLDFLGRTCYNQRSFILFKMLMRTNRGPALHAAERAAPQGCCKQREFSITRSTVTNILQLMERKGYIQRQSVPQDARLKQLVLTEEGVRFHENTILSFHQTDDYVANLLTEEENAELLRLLNKLRDALK